MEFRVITRCITRPIALYAYLTRTSAMLVGVSLAEAAGERRPQNLPGTVDEYPNWRIPLAGSDGVPVLLEDLPAHPGVRAVAKAVSGGIRHRGAPSADGAPRVVNLPGGSGYGVTELTEVPQFAIPSLVPPQVPTVRVNWGGRQFGYWM
jgi:hypothetical protein